MTSEQFCKHYPFVYHMAKAGTWDCIRKLGLKSTTAILDLFEISSSEREAIESCRRPKSVVISHKKYGNITIRDNIPITESKLKRCLIDMTPRQWFETLNRKVFFWSTKEKLLDLLQARAYRNHSHDIITVDSKLLLNLYANKIFLSHINSGAMPYGGSPRGTETFCQFAKWPIDEGSRSGKLKKPIVEVAVDYHVPKIDKIAIRVEEMQGEQIIRTIWESA